MEISVTFGYVQSLDYAEKMISKFETKNAVKNFPVTGLTRTLEIMVYTTEVNYRLNLGDSLVLHYTTSFAYNINCDI